MGVLSLLQYWYVATAVIVVAILALAVHDYLQQRRLPPGPPPVPFIGNKRSIPIKYPWIRFQEWSKSYGPIYTIWLGRRPTVIISDPGVAVELMEKRSQKYSSRPRFVVMGEVYWRMASILVQPYGKDWSVRRKLLHSALTPRALGSYHNVQEAEACRLCYKLLTSPTRWEQLLDWMTASIVFSISYGHRIDSLDSPVIRQRLKCMHYSASLNVPGKYLAESFPILSHVPTWLPFTGWKRDVIQNGNIEANANMQLVEFVKSEMAHAQQTGTILRPSLCKNMLENRSANPLEFSLLSDRDFSFIPASLFGAGADTTASTLCSAFLAVVTNPHTLILAHAELDAVIGSDRLPTFDDESSLPYLRALIKEILRWRPVAVLGGTPHATSEADTYKSYHIPKGTNVLGNTWAINHNEDYYPDSQSFNPLRFLDVDASSLSYLPKEILAQHPPPPEPRARHPSRTGHSSFGWGRRICPGADLASNNLFIALARIFWVFNISPKKGVQYDVWDYVGGFNVRPRSFECDITIRDEKKRCVLEEGYHMAVEVMEEVPLFQEHEIDI